MTKRTVPALLVLLAFAHALPATALDLQSTTAPGRTVPSLSNGEIAINRADKSLFFKNVDGTIGVGSLLNALPAGRKAVEQGDASDLVSIAGPAGSPLRSLPDRFQDIAWLPDCRFVTDPDWTAAWNRCGQRAREVYIPPGTYTVGAGGSPAIVYQNVKYRGGSRGQTILTLAAGANTDVLQTDGAYSLFGTNSPGGAARWDLSNITLDGNASQQTATGADIDKVNGIALYGAAWRMDNVVIRNVKGHGIRSEWFQFGENVGGIEATVTNVTVDTAGRHGWWHKGPHDIHVTKLITIDASQEADSTYAGVYTDGFSNGRFYDFHGWHRGATTNRVNFQFDSGGSNTIVGSHLEGGRSQLRHRAGGGDQVVGSLIYAHFGGDDSSLVVMRSPSNVHSGNRYIGSNSRNMYALQVGEAGGGNASNNVIVGGVFNSFPNRTPFNFVNDAGTNTIEGQGFANTGGATTWGGTKQATTRLTYSQSGTAINWRPDLPGSAQVADGTASGGNARGPFASDSQRRRADPAQVASGENATLSGGQSNTASGANSTVSGGLLNTAPAFGSTVIGGQENVSDGNYSGGASFRGTARGRYGFAYQAGGSINSLGDAQTGVTVMRGSGQGTAAIRLLASSAAANADPGTANCLPIPDNMAFGLRILVQARVSGAPGNTYTWSMPVASMLRGAGAGSTVVTLGTAATISTGSFAPTVSATADTALGCLNLTLTPPAGNTAVVRASARVETVEIQ